MTRSELECLIKRQASFRKSFPASLGIEVLYMQRPRCAAAAAKRVLGPLSLVRVSLSSCLIEWWSGLQCWMDPVKKACLAGKFRGVCDMFGLPGTIF